MSRKKAIENVREKRELMEGRLSGVWEKLLKSDDELGIMRAW